MRHAWNVGETNEYILWQKQRSEMSTGIIKTVLVRTLLLRLLESEVSPVRIIILQLDDYKIN